ncbi:MAG TPA: phosphatidylglycerophosphatase A [Bryobacteraceae bacterium]|nr:phosphatidylglycerophosphatase A [Bryobacteraceae bacterium]
MTILARVIATWFYCGYAPVGPGTVGSAAAILIAWLLHTYAFQSGMSLAVLGVALAIPGIWAAGVTARAINSKDPGIVVVDEVVGQWITLAGATDLNWRSWLVAFCVFRIFDIWKPPPVRQLEKLPGGLGIVADDAMAGVYGALVLFAAGWFHLY